LVSSVISPIIDWITLNASKISVNLLVTTKNTHATFPDRAPASEDR
jgi:hypothetical protein